VRAQSTRSQISAGWSPKASAVEHAGLGRPPRQQRAAQGVGLDGHVDHVLALREGLEAMVDRGDRRAGALDDDVDRRVAHQGLPVVADMGAAVAQRGVEAGGLHALRLPAHARQVAQAACTPGVRGDRSAMPTRCMPGVRGTCARYIVAAGPNLPAPISARRGSAAPSRRRAAAVADSIPPQRRAACAAASRRKACACCRLNGLALTPHPLALGSALTHPHITTDYSESPARADHRRAHRVRGLLNAS
jgi:hypothetical protein